MNSTKVFTAIWAVVYLVLAVVYLNLIERFDGFTGPGIGAHLFGGFFISIWAARLGYAGKAYGVIHAWFYQVLFYLSLMMFFAFAGVATHQTAAYDIFAGIFYLLAVLFCFKAGNVTARAFADGKA